MTGRSNLLDIQRNLMTSEPVPLDKIPMGARGDIIDMDLIRESMPQSTIQQPQRIQVRTVSNEGDIGAIHYPGYRPDKQDNNFQAERMYVVGEESNFNENQARRMPPERTYVIEHTVRPEDVTFGSPRATPVQDSSASLAFGPRMQDDYVEPVQEPDVEPVRQETRNVPDVDAYVPQVEKKQKVMSAIKKKAEAKKVDPTNEIDAKVKDSVIKIIAKDMRTRIKAQFEERGKDASEQKIENELRAWYWSVGFEDIIVNDRDVKLIVQRPNRFIGKNNYLFYIRAVLSKFGYKLSLVKASPNDVYKSFFGGEA